MRGQCFTAIVGLVACSVPEPAAGTEGSESTTLMVASFGEDTAASTTSTTSSSTTTSVSEVSTDPTVDPSTTTDPVTTDPSDPSDPTSVTSLDTSEESSTGEPPPPPPTCATISATIHDFSVEHPDMAMPGGGVILPGLVLPTLGMTLVPELDPAYMGAVTITSADSFAQWYTDVPEVNVAIAVELELYEESPGRTVFDGPVFLPIDGLGLGNEGQANNYYFTTAVHTELVYSGGEVMSFGGDDDVWVFIDGRLAADVGGQHAALFVEVALDDLMLEPGHTYAIDVFHAERGVGGSRLRFELGDFCD